MEKSIKTFHAVTTDYGGVLIANEGQKESIRLISRSDGTTVLKIHVTDVKLIIEMFKKIGVDV